MLKQSGDVLVKDRLSSFFIFVFVHFQLEKKIRWEFSLPSTVLRWKKICLVVVCLNFREQNEQLANFEKEIAMLKEVISSKDEIVMKTTNEVRLGLTCSLNYLA